TAAAHPGRGVGPGGGLLLPLRPLQLRKAGVPALYAKGGDNLVDGGTEAGKAAGMDYTTHRYHKPADEFSSDWNLGGIIQDLDALYAVGREVAASEAWPQWREGNPFRAAREASMAEAADGAAPAQ